VTSWVSVFVVRMSRGGDGARELLGETFAGLLVTDRDRRLAKIICPFLFSMCYDRLYAEPNKRDHCSKVYHFEAALG
jgi:hypothetical protein